MYINSYTHYSISLKYWFIFEIVVPIIIASNSRGVIVGTQVQTIVLNVVKFLRFTFAFSSSL